VRGVSFPEAPTSKRHQSLRRGYFASAVATSAPSRGGAVQVAPPPLFFAPPSSLLHPESPDVHPATTTSAAAAMWTA
jgi:hypothetical protein